MHRDGGLHMSREIMVEIPGKSASRCQNYFDVPSSCSLRSAFMRSPSSYDYFLAGATFVENMSRSSFHLPPSFRQTTMYFP